MALTLVTSGTTTPTVGTNSVLDTETPGSPTLYVLEVDTSVLQTGDSLILSARKTGTSIKKGATYVGGVVSASTAAVSMIPARAFAGAPLVVSVWANSTTIPTFTDSESNTFTTLQTALTTQAGVSLIAPAPNPFASNDWLNPTCAFAPGDSLTAGATAAFSVIQAASIIGANPGAVAYASATAVSSNATPTVTSGSITSGDIVVGFVQTGGAVVTITPPAGWTVIGTIAGNPGGAIMVNTASSTATQVFNPTLSGSANCRLHVFGIPAGQAGSTVAEAVLSGVQHMPIKQSIPIPVNTSEPIEFDLLQYAGTARAFPWKVWHL